MAAAAELDPDSQPDGDSLSPALLVNCDAPPSQHADFEPVASASEASLIYGSGIRNHRKLLNTNNMKISNIR